MLAHKAPFKDPPFLWANSSSILGSLKWFPKSSPWMLKNTSRNWVIHDDWWQLDNHGLIESDQSCYDTHVGIKVVGDDFGEYLQ